MHLRICANFATDSLGMARYPGFSNYVNMNTGVMLMNTERSRESLSEFREYIRQNLAELERESWDEAAYRWFYRDSMGRSGTG
jgi:hypothetical protein